MKSVNIKVVGEERELLQFLSLCAKMDFLGSIGSSRDIDVFYDGDGSARLRFECIVSEINKSEEIDIILDMKARMSEQWFKETDSLKNMKHDIGCV